MINLVGATDKLQLVTSVAATIDVVASYVDLTISGGVFADANRQVAAITTATTTDVVATPASGKTRNVKTLTARNKHASLDVDVTLLLDVSATDYELFKCTLRAGEQLMYIEGVGFFVYAATLANLNLTSGESSFGQNVLGSVLSPVAVGTFVTITGTAYYIYVGRVPRDITVLYAELHVTTAGAGAQTAELGLFSTPLPPSTTAQTLTKIVATGTVDSLTATGMKRNTASFAQLVPAGTHLWAAYRGAMATTQITAAGLAGDFSEGHILTTTGGGALTALSTASGSIPAIATATVAPNIRVRLT